MQRLYSVANSLVLVVTDSQGHTKTTSVACIFLACTENAIIIYTLEEPVFESILQHNVQQWRSRDNGVVSRGIYPTISGPPINPVWSPIIFQRSSLARKPHYIGKRRHFVYCTVPVVAHRRRGGVVHSMHTAVTDPLYPRKVGKVACCVLLLVYGRQNTRAEVRHTDTVQQFCIPVRMFVLCCFMACLFPVSVMHPRIYGTVSHRVNCVNQSLVPGPLVQGRETPQQ